MPRSRVYVWPHARTYVSDRAVAEEVVQETWLGVIRGIDRFEGRSSLKTWIYRILTNTAKKRGVHERRTVPFSALVSGGDDGVVDADRFLPAGNLWAGTGHPRLHPGARHPRERLLAGEARELIEVTISTLRETQREIITLRDVDGWSPEEVCNVLDLIEVNQPCPPSPRPREGSTVVGGLLLRNGSGVT